MRLLCVLCMAIATGCTSVRYEEPETGRAFTVTRVLSRTSFGKLEAVVTDAKGNEVKRLALDGYESSPEAEIVKAAVEAALRGGTP